MSGAPRRSPAMRSPEAEAYRHLYLTRAWKELRACQLAMRPLCEWCERRGRVTAASIADHVIPHKGNETLFFDPSNLMSLCKPHHDAGKQKSERAGYSAEPDDDGWPIDPRHPANLAKREVLRTPKDIDDWFARLPPPPEVRDE